MSENKVQGMNVALVIAPDQFRDEELFTPKELLEQQGAKTQIAACKLGTAQGMLGKTAEPQVLVKDLKTDSLDAIVVVGGMGSPEYLWNDKELHALLKDMTARNKVVSAICLSGAVLANAGVLNGRKATVYETDESKKALADGGANFTGAAVEQDGKMITANGPEAAEAFANLIIEELAKVKV